MTQRSCPLQTAYGLRIPLCYAVLWDQGHFKTAASNTGFKLSAQLEAQGFKKGRVAKQTQMGKQGEKEVEGGPGMKELCTSCVIISPRPEEWAAMDIFSHCPFVLFKVDFEFDCPWHQGGTQAGPTASPVCILVGCLFVALLYPRKAPAPLL